MRGITIAATAALLLAGCAGTAEVDSTETTTPTVAQSESEEPLDTSAIRDAPTAECRDTMKAVEAALHEHYETYDTSQGEIDYDAEEEDFSATIAPIYDACDGPHDLMAGFRAFPYVSGSTDASFVDNIVLDSYCYPEPTSRACSGYEDALALYVP